MYCIYINDKEAPFTEWIMEGNKRAETRNRDSLKSVMFESPLGIIRTGKGEPTLVGILEFRCRWLITDERKWNKAMWVEDTMVEGTSFEKWHGRKAVYCINWAKRLPEPIPLKELTTIRKTRSFVEIKEELV